MIRSRRILGVTVRSYRKAKGLSQMALGRKADLCGKFIGEVERGEKSISVDSLARVARALRVSLTRLVRGIA